METPAELKYTNEHEWAKEENDGFQMGITDYAQNELGDVVFVDLPEVGASVTQGESCVTVESVKAVSDVYAPISGTVVAINDDLVARPELINESPFENGWLLKIEATDPAEAGKLLDANAYTSFVEELSK